MKKFFLLSIIVFYAFSLKAQLFEISNDPIFRDETGKIKTLALAGGLNQPQFSAYDFNKDGKMDLFVYDRTGNKVLVFISETTLGNIKFRYDPSYEDFFPKGAEFMQLHDYDNDGKADLWTYIADGATPDSVMLYRNVSTTLPKFDKVKGLFALDKVNYVPFNPNKKLSHIKGCLPAIHDVDADGDIDFITNLNIIGSNMILNCNTSTDRGVPLTDIGYQIVDKCYGGIAEYDGELTIHSPCEYNEAYLKRKHSASKTLLFFDNDGDGDNDLFYGSSEKLTNPLYYFENGKSDLGYYKDTFIRIDTAYFPQVVESQIPVAPGMFYVDIDLDGVNDLILANNEHDKSSYPIHEKNNVLLFLNKGANNNPDFQLLKNDFLVGDMIDLGGRNSPTFADLDGDGDQDLIMATSGDHYFTGDTTDFLVYYQNIGSSTNPDFKLISSDYLSLKAEEYRRLVPTFADVDGDSDLDMFLGKQDGSISFYQNTGTKLSPSFTLITETYQEINVDANAAPVFHDLDKDGTLDLLIGNYNGTINYYRNTGSSSAASFSLVTDSLGGIVVNELISQRFLGDTGLYDSLVYLYYGNSAPQVITYSTGARCLAVGNEEGTIKIYDIPSDITQKYTPATNYMKREFVHTAYTKDWGRGTYPAVADLNGDGIKDILVGNLRGGVHYMQGKDLKTGGISRNFSLLPFQLFPNPVNEEVTIYAPSDKLLNYTITSISGQIVRSGAVSNGGTINGLSSLSNGFYFVNLADSDQQFAPQKMVVNK
jgi:hypothetical protein